MPDTPARPTLLQRAVLWILHALMFHVVALYPVLLMARFQPDDVVHYGFLRWIAVVLVLYWAASQLFFTERPVDTRPGRQTLAVTAGILLVLGVFTPIVSFPFVGDVDFFRGGYGDGYILLAMAGLSVALAVTGRWKQVLVPGLGALAVVLWTFLSVQDTVSQARSGAPATLAGNPHEGLAASVMQAIEWKWGWLLLFAGSGLLVYSAARRDELADEASPFAPVGIEDQPAAAPFEAAREEPASMPAEPTAGAPADEASAPAEQAAAEPADASAPDETTANASASAETTAAGQADETSESSESTAAGSADASAPAEAAAAGPAGEAGAGAVEAAGETAVPAGETRSAPAGAAEPAATPESAAAEGPVTAAAETPAKPPETAAGQTPQAPAGDAETPAKPPMTAAEQTPPATAGDAAADDAPPATQPAEAKAPTPTPEAAAAEPATEESEAAANEPVAKKD